MNGALHLVHHVVVGTPENDGSGGPGLGAANTQTETERNIYFMTLLWLQFELGKKKYIYTSSFREKTPKNLRIFKMSIIDVMASN